MRKILSLINTVVKFRQGRGGGDIFSKKHLFSILFIYLFFFIVLFVIQDIVTPLNKITTFLTSEKVNKNSFG